MNEALASRRGRGGRLGLFLGVAAIALAVSHLVAALGDESRAFDWISAMGWAGFAAFHLRVWWSAGRSGRS